MATGPRWSSKRAACRASSSPPTEPGGRCTSKISPLTSRGASAATSKRAGTSSSLAINGWQPARADRTQATPPGAGLGLQRANGCSLQARREEPRPERAGAILPERREPPERGLDARGHVTELPADLL